MSPGATFERVYNELKRMLAEGELPPGTPIEPALIGRQIASSITPIRDALHRLTGEGLVEAPNHNGFRVPRPTEAGLRDLYNWNGQLLTLAARQYRVSPQAVTAGPPARRADAVLAIASLFIDITRATGSIEHVRAIQSLNDRLAPLRSLESQLLDGIAEERDQLARHLQAADRTRLVRLLQHYHRRRLQIVPDLVALHVDRPPR